MGILSDAALKARFRELVRQREKILEHPDDPTTVPRWRAATLEIDKVLDSFLAQRKASQ